MKIFNRLPHKLISLLLCLAMVLSYLPAGILHASAATTDPRVTDPHTLDQWKNFFGNQTNHSQNISLSTEYAGGIWTDKSVFTPGNIPSELTSATYNNQSISIEDKKDNFLVALSAIASNKQIKGYSTIPTDTVIVLDLSSSMRYTDDNGSSAVDELVEATNKAITDLLELNKNNRIAVVVYAGNVNKSFSSADGITQVVLPLDSYTTTSAGEYLVSASVNRNPNHAIEVKSGVKNSAGTSMSSNRFEVSTGTYMQDGIYEAMKLLLSAEPVVQEGVQAGTSRIPIMILMTDGEPTLANNDYNGNNSRTDLGVSNLQSYNGSTGTYSHRDTIAFMTSLTAAFAKKQIAAHYGTDALMYTLPYGDAVLNRPEALSVLDPVNASSVQNTLWNRFLAGENIAVFRSGDRQNYQYLYTSNSSVESEKLTAADRFYVDKYFPAQNDDQMLNAFASIVGEIIIQSKYYPTFVEKDHNHDGYLTFVDKIGSYMEVSDITGIVIGSRLFSGAALASKFPANTTESIVASNVLGDALLDSVKNRLGITDDAVAAALVQDAYDHNQLIYVDENNYDHYIGWFSDQDGKYVDFWHKDITAEQINSAITKGATHIIRSYAFLGDTTVVPGMSNTDMMYMSVRVATEIQTGESIVTWRIPASLVPTITYEVEVEVDEDGAIADIINLELADTTADSPIRLLYEVALREDIYDWNIAQKIDATYKQNNGYVFYSNKWNANANNTTLNTYSHFEPSVQNERYYYTQDTAVMVKTGTDTYEIYTSANKPSGEGYYHVYQVFEKLENGSLRTHNHYEPISADAMQSVVASDSNQWVIPKGTIHRYYDYEIATKAENPTGTMNYSDHPFVVKNNAIYYTYSTQGNNGKLTVTPATGIALTKALADGYTSDATFTFVIDGAIAGAQIVRVNANGLESGRADLPANGEVTLTAGETVYIIGLTAGNYTVTEKIPAGADYRVRAVRVNGLLTTGTGANVTLTEQTVASVEFTNDKQGYGDLIISKDVMHPFASAPSALTNEQFTIRVDLNGDNTANRTFAASGLTGITNITTDSDGVFTVQLRHNEALTVKDLPEGTTYTVTENITQAGYSLNPQLSTLSGSIPSGSAALGHVVNTYAPAPAEQTLIISGTKTVTDDAGTFDWTNKSFSFKLERYDPETATYTQIGSMTTVTTNGGSYAFDALTFDTLGTYYYKVSEVIPAAADRLDGMSYDATTGRIVVHVTDTDVDGKLEIDVQDYTTGVSLTASGNVFTFTKDFVNVHVTDATYVEFTVDKIVTDPHNIGISEAGFLFGLYKVENGTVASAPSFTMRTVDSTGKATFHIPLNKVTEDTYILKEIHPAQQDKIPGMIYSTAEYTVIVKAVSQNGTLSPSVRFEQNGQAVDANALTFENVMQLTPATVQWAVEKNLIGDPAQSESFTFWLRETDSSFENVKAGGAWQNISIVNEGTKTFDAIEYTKVGTYYYVVSEVAGSKGGMTYDAAQYHITVNVTANGNALAADVNINKLGTGTVDEILFTNTYTRTGSTSVIIEGTKTLTGRPMLNGEFHFLLEQVADAQGTAMVQPLILRAENSVSVNNVAAFRFAPITYSELGQYFYRITEVPGISGNGVTYSNASYIVKVVVQDNNAGGYTSDWSIIDANALSFVNTYRPADTHADILASKELTGKVLIDGQFDFTLTETQNDFTTVLSGGVYREVKNNAAGVIDFGRLTYSSEGTHYYVVREKIPATRQPGIVYDETEYHVTVVVTDNHRGSLIVTTSIEMIVENDTTSVIPTSSIAFYNNYKITEGATVELTGTKTLANKTLTDNMFTFELYETNDTYAIDGLTPSTVQNANGTYRFLLSYAPEDAGKTFYYLVKEKNAGETINGITYSSVAYRIRVTVEDNGSGGIKTTVTGNGLTSTVNGNATTVSGMDFENTYTAAPATYTPKATKRYDNDMRTFTFVLSGEGFATQEKNNDVQGNILFDTLTFIKAGTYRFTIKEQKNLLWNFIKWDVNEYTLTIPVEDDGNGNLVVGTVVITSTDGRTDLVFDNSYIHDNGTLMLTIEKLLTGDRTDPSGFQFGLYEVGSDAPFDTRISDIDGIVAFKTITYTEEGTHSYIIREILPTENGKVLTYKDGVTYDTTEYRVDVTVTDDKNGKLIVTYQVDGQDVEEETHRFVFRNSYSKLPENPKTGDTSNLALWFSTMTASGCALIASVICTKRKETEEVS